MSEKNISNLFCDEAFQEGKLGSISVNPATQLQLAHFPYLTSMEIESTLILINEQFKNWKRTSFEQRAKFVKAIAVLLLKQSEKIATMITNEMGKPISQSMQEVKKCAELCSWYAENGGRMLVDEKIILNEGEGEAWISYRPLGAILTVMPWNYPLWQVIRAVIPLILAGNVVVLKHARNVMGCAFKLQQVFSEAGLPNNVLTVLNIKQSDVADIIIDDRIAGVTVTGSVAAGSAIAAQAGKAIKKTILELGGSDPFIVLADANIKAAAKAAVTARFQNNGQVCIAAKRIIIEAHVLDDFTKHFINELSQLKIGDPLDPSIYFGPMARQDLREQLHQQVQKSVQAGAKLLCGGHYIDKDGYFYAPTVLTSVTKNMPLFQQESFGPVAVIISAKNLEEALQLANASEYGLSASIWTTDIKRALSAASHIETGAICINKMSTSDPRLPIGGVKKSGYGRELSYYGIREFTNIQTIWCKP